MMGSFRIISLCYRIPDFRAFITELFFLSAALTTLWTFCIAYLYIAIMPISSYFFFSSSVSSVIGQRFLSLIGGIIKKVSPIFILA